MRLKCSRVKKYYVKSAVNKKDSESSAYVEYGAPIEFAGEVWPGGGKVQAEMFGERLSYIRNIRINDDYVIQIDSKGRVHYLLNSGADITESDGICIYVSKDEQPDYKIISIKPYSVLRLEVEKIV